MKVQKEKKGEEINLSMLGLNIRTISTRNLVNDMKKILLFLFLAARRSSSSYFSFWALLHSLSLSFSPEAGEIKVGRGKREREREELGGAGTPESFSGREMGIICKMNLDNLVVYVHSFEVFFLCKTWLSNHLQHHVSSSDSCLYCFFLRR